MTGFRDCLELRSELCEIGRRLYARELCSGYDGNLSCRLNDGTFLCTPTQTGKGFLRPELLCTVDATGHQLSGPRPRTSEILLHLEIFRRRPDVGAVIHCHPPCASAFAIVGESLPQGVLAEADGLLGPVPVAPFGLPGTAEFASTVTEYLPHARAILLANHGAVTFAATLEDAWSRAECLETSARIMLAAIPLGGGRLLPTAARAALARFLEQGHY
jgi:L-fuculose-phosphate aldolase